LEGKGVVIGAFPGWFDSYKTTLSPSGVAGNLPIPFESDAEHTIAPKAEAKGAAMVNRALIGLLKDNKVAVKLPYGGPLFEAEGVVALAGIVASIPLALTALVWFLL